MNFFHFFKICILYICILFVKSDDKRLGEINRRMESCLADLVKEQTGFILVSLDLATIVSIIAQVYT